MEPELIADYACHTGEGPLWHPDEKQLYWVDIPAGRMFRYDPLTNQHEPFYQGDPVGGFTVQEAGGLLLFGPRGCVRFWEPGGETAIIEEIPTERNTRFNDVIADPVGRVYAGTMPAPDHPSRLYRLDTDGLLNLVLDDLGQANGMGFSPDRRWFYLTDTRARAIYRFDYDGHTGALANRQLFAEIPRSEEEGHPDGLTVDAEGGIWSARWGGGCVVRYAPDGSETDRIRIPTPNVSSMAFGGDDYGDLYVTTAGGHEKQKNGPHAGALFRVRPGCRGTAEFHSRIPVT